MPLVEKKKGHFLSSNFPSDLREKATMTDLFCNDYLVISAVWSKQCAKLVIKQRNRCNEGDEDESSTAVRTSRVILFLTLKSVMLSVHRCHVCAAVQHVWCAAAVQASGTPR